MLAARFATGRRPLRLLAIGAHCDDIEIGAGATILSLLEDRPVHVDWVVLTSTSERMCEARVAASLFLKQAVGSSVVVHGFRDGFLPYEGPAVKEAFEGLKHLGAPDVVLTHTRHDLHQDHRLVCELTWNTFRDHLILEYEIPKYDGDLGQPNFFAPVSERTLQRKWQLLDEAYPSQRSRRWFSEDTFRAIARIRGIESGSATGFAEGFTMRKAVLGLGTCSS